MAQRPNQYYYGAPNQPSSPDTQAGQNANVRMPQGYQENSRDPYMSPSAQQQNIPHRGAYRQPNHGQAQTSSPRSQLPYPTYPHEDLPPRSPASNQHPYPYQHQSSPPPSTYNPQHYAQTSSSASYSTPQSYGPPVPPRPWGTRPPPPQPYNPAAYSPALNHHPSSADQSYNAQNGSRSQGQANYGANTYQSTSPQNQQAPPLGTYAGYQNNQRSPVQPSNYTSQQYSSSFPHPARTYSLPPDQELHRDPRSHPYYTDTRQGHSSSVQHTQAVGSSSRPTGNSDSRSYHLHSSSAYNDTTHQPSPSSHIAGRDNEEHPDWPRSSGERIDAPARHPQARPLPGPPGIEPDAAPTYTAGDDHEYYDYYDDEYQDQLFDELEDAIGGGRGRASSEQPSTDDYQRSPNDVHAENSSRNARVNGMRGMHNSAHQFSSGYADSDAMAAAGLEAMARAAEEEEQEEQRRRSQASGTSVDDFGSADRHPPVQGDSESSDEDFPYDISSYEGGFGVSMSYGSDPNMRVTSLPQNDRSALQRQHPSTSSKGSVSRSVDGLPVRTSSNTSLTDFSAGSLMPPPAQVDQALTGGLADPSLFTRKMSFDDSSDDLNVDEQAAPGAAMSAGPPDLPHPPSLSMSRPLPPTPSQEEARSASSGAYSSSSSPNVLYQPEPNNFNQSTAQGPHVPRSISLLSHPSNPRPQEPARAKTDGRRQGLRVSTYNVDMPTGGSEIQTPAHVWLGIPALPPGRRFHPSKLSQRDFDGCTEPWALSNVSNWLRAMAEGESELRDHTILEGLVALFTAKVPNINISIAEGLAANTLTELLRAGVLVHEEEWLKFGIGHVTGVLYQLTGKGCYAPFLHTSEISGRCYAPHCQTMIKKISLDSQRASQATDWATFYNISSQDRENSTKNDIQLQNNLHEIVTSEDAYMDQLHVLINLYRDGLKAANPAVIGPQRLPNFLRDVFGKLDAVQAANEEHLLPQLKYRQQEQGPWISGFSDIFRHWIRKAKTAYIEYAASFPNANFLMKWEESHNSMFATFVEEVRSNKLSNRLEWSSFLRAPITRLQRYSLLLSTVQKHMPSENATELANLELALKEIRAVTMECDSKVAESGKKADLQDLEGKIILRPEMKGAELNLKQHGRKILTRGDLQRTGGSRLTWLHIHTILLDNYLVMAKTVTPKESNGSARYDISKMPIPMDLLVVESANDDPVEKTYRGISTVTSGQGETRHSRANSSVTPGQLAHSATNASLSTVDSTTSTSTKSMVPSTVVGESSGDSKVLYPFRIRHLGRETYTLYANSADIRKHWCDSIINAKTEHAASLYAQNAEPFKLRVLADTSFAYDNLAGRHKSVMIEGSPLARAVSEVEKMYEHKGRPPPACRARVNCATAFRQPHGNQMIQTHMVAVGTDYGVYVAEYGSPRGWSRVIPVLKVTQIAVLEDFNLFILISDKTLIAYHLDVVCPPSGASANSDSVRKAPQKLSGSKDVSFFVTGKMKDRTLVFYKKGGMSSSTFKILEPILQRGSEKKSRNLLLRGNTLSFRDYDDFYIPTECTALDVFTSTLAVATSKGLEILNLDKKTPFSVPDLEAPHVAQIAQRLSGVSPLAMFRLNELEFLCVYEECAVYVNKHGDISRSVVMEFVGKAKAAALEGGYLILFDPDFVEIRNAQAGSLKQVIAGTDIRCLDNGRGGASGVQRSVKFALQHPEQERTQIVVELVLDATRRL